MRSLTSLLGFFFGATVKFIFVLCERVIFVEFFFVVRKNHSLRINASVEREGERASASARVGERERLNKTLRECAMC